MDDPLSATANAVGIISLGLQTCDQIVSYCQAWSNYSNDIQRLGKKADSLRVPLKRLRDLIEDAQLTDPKIPDDLETKADDLQDSVEGLREKLERWQPVMDTFPDRVRTQLNEMAHLFRRESLRNMENDLDGMEQSLQTTLEIYMAQKIARLGKMQEKTFNMVQEMHSSMSQVYARGMPAPDLLRSWCENEPESSQLMSNTIGLQSETETGIQDVVHTGLPADQRWAVTLRRNQRRYHTKLVAKTYQYYSRFLNLAITASFTATGGAGGFSFSPLVKVQYICSPECWQSKTELYSIVGINVPTPVMTTMLLDTVVNDFRQAFGKGKANPMDIIPSMFYPSKTFSLIDALDSAGAIANKIGNVRDLSKWVRFLGSCGSVPNNKSSVGLLAGLCKVRIWNDEERSLASYLLDIGGPLESLPKSVIEKINMRWMLSEDGDAISCPDIIKIIIRESSEELENDLLSSRVKASNRVCGQLLLDYAIGWPQGVRILLEHGADPNSVEWTSRLKTDWLDESPDPRNRHDSDGVFESVKILLDAGYRVNIEKIVWPFLPRRIQTLLIQGLVVRRRKLWEWAPHNLPSSKLAELSKEPDGIIDLKVAYLHDTIKPLGKELDSSLQESRWWKPRHSVYHFQPRFLHPETLDELYTAGFRDIDVLDPLGVTPCMNGCIFVHDVRKWAWFASKGADCSRKLPYSNATVAHLWSASIIKELFQAYFKHMIVPSNDLKEWKESLSTYGEQVLLLPTAPDECLCPCSPGGCTTLSVVFRKFSNLFPGFSQAATFERFPLLQKTFPPLKPDELHASGQAQIRQILQILIDRCHGKLGAEETIIRSLTFEGLGIKHACCTEIHQREPNACDMKGRNYSEVEEILSEEKQRYQELEKLMTEFGAKFEVLGLSLWQFLTDHWQPRMVEYLSQRDLCNGDHDKEARRLGVFLKAGEMEIPSWLYLFENMMEELEDVTS